MCGKTKTKNKNKSVVEILFGRTTDPINSVHAVSHCQPYCCAPLHVVHAVTGLIFITARGNDLRIPAPPFGINAVPTETGKPLLLFVVGTEQQQRFLGVLLAMCYYK